MSLRARIFTVSFSFSILLLGAAALMRAFFAPAFESANLMEIDAAASRIVAMAGVAMAGENIDPEALLAAMAPIRRDITRRLVLERDAAAVATVGWVLFLVMAAIVAFAVSAIAARIISARWARLGDGILSIRRGVSFGPFYRGTADEFGVVEAELDELVSALAEKERMRSELRALQGWGEASAFLAHQARTPLSSLTMSARTARVSLDDARGSLDDARGSLDDAGESRKTGLAGSLDKVSAALERTELEAGRLTAIFNRVRSLSGFREPELEDFSPSEALFEAAAILAARGLPCPPDALTVEDMASGPRPRFDRAYLVEALGNLLANSAEACGEKGIAMKALLTIESSAENYVLGYEDSVRDLDPALAGLVGTPRFTTKASGMGLGIWLVGRITALHGGTMEVSMTESNGLRFSLRFPCKGCT